MKRIIGALAIGLMLATPWATPVAGAATMPAVASDESASDQQAGEPSAADKLLAEADGTAQPAVAGIGDAIERSLDSGMLVATATGLMVLATGAFVLRRRAA